mgnify:CR=1 FL=1
MAQIDENIKKQLDKPQVWFCKYFPKRIQNVGEKEIADRDLGWKGLRESSPNDCIEYERTIWWSVYKHRILSSSGIYGQEE